MRRTDLQLQISVALQRKKSPHFKNQIQKASAKFTLLATVLHKPSRGKLKISQHIKNPSEGVKELTRQWRFAGLRSRTGGQCRKEGPAFFLTIFLLEVQAYLNFLYFSLLQSTDIVLFFFFFFTNWRSMAAQHWVSLSAQFSKQHLPTLNLLSHFGNSHNISNFFSVSIFVMVICDQWSLMLLLQLTEGSDDGEEKCF